MAKIVPTQHLFDWVGGWGVDTLFCRITVQIKCWTRNTRESSPPTILWEVPSIPQLQLEAVEAVEAVEEAVEAEELLLST